MTKLARLSKVFLIFWLVSLATNLTMEVLVPTPEKAAIVEEHGWGYYYTVQVRGIVLFYAIFSLAGSYVFVTQSYRTRMMGLLSTALGYFFEFAFMRPDWVRALLALQLSPALFFTLLVTTFYWYIAWGLPTYVTHRWFRGIP